MIAEDVDGMEFADPWRQKPHPENRRVPAHGTKRREISSRKMRGMVKRSLCAGRRIHRSECGRKNRPARFEMTAWRRASATANFRSGLTSHAEPFEYPPRMRIRMQLEWQEWQSPMRFSFACSLKILGLQMSLLQDEAIVFSMSPPSDRSRVGEACSGDGEERGRSAKPESRRFDSRTPIVRTHTMSRLRLVQSAKTTIV